MEGSQDRRAPAADEASRRTTDRTQALLRVIRNIAGHGDQRSVLSQILEEGAALLEADAGVVYQFDGALERFVPVQQHGPFPSAVPTLEIGQGVVGQAAIRRGPVVVPRYEQESVAPDFGRDIGIQSVVAAPLQNDGRLLGVITFARFAADASFDASDGAILELLAGIVAAEMLGIERARLSGALLSARTAQHELNNLLAIVSGYVELMAIDPALPIHLRSAARIAIDKIQDAARTLHALRSIVRIEEAIGDDQGGTIDLGRSQPSRPRRPGG